MSPHQQCPDCQDSNHQDLQNIVNQEELPCCQEKNQDQGRVSQKSTWQKFINLFQKND